MKPGLLTSFLNHMRSVTGLPCIISFILFSNCSGDTEPIRRLHGYEYPWDSLKDGRIFVYRKNTPGEYLFIERRLVNENGVEYVLSESYDLNKKISAEKFRLTTAGLEEIETYLYRYPDSLKNQFQKDKGEILESRNILDGQKYRGSIFKMKILTSGNIQGKMTVQETYIREDRIRLTEKDSLLNVLIFKSDMTVKAWHKFLPFFSSETIYTGENFYGEGLGLVRFSTNTANETSEWTLERIDKLD
jgi:hypothetical protein